MQMEVTKQANHKRTSDPERMQTPGNHATEGRGKQLVESACSKLLDIIL